MKKNSLFMRLTALLCLTVFLFSLFAVSAAADGEEGTQGSSPVQDLENPEEEEPDKRTTTLTISTPEEFISFASKCRQSSYTRNMVVELQDDLDLSGLVIMPIPSFSGVFHGNGHTISGFVLAANGSHQGLFRYVEQVGEIYDLIVQGSVQPSGSQSDVGGLAGSNYGIIQNCSFSGTVQGLVSVGGIAGENYGYIVNSVAYGTIGGKHFTGGVVGYNEGIVSRCSNHALVNIVIRENEIDIRTLDLSDIIGINLVSSEDSDTVSDAGGVVGINLGSVLDCGNYATVGYQHYGYNIGGVVGRQSGYMCGCYNEGEIFGRKDVGGVVGQMEPYLIVDDSLRLSDEIDAFNQAMNGAMGDMSANSAQLEDSRVEVGNSISGVGSSSGSKEEDSTSAGDKIQNTVGTIGDKLNGAANDLGNDTINNIISGDLTDDDYNNIGTVGGGLISDGAGAIGDKIEQKKEEKEKEEKEKENSGGSSLADIQRREEYASLAGSLGNMGSALHTTLSDLAGDMSSVTYHFSNILTMMSNAISGNLQLTVLTDISELDTDDDIDGKVQQCTNAGRVNGDSNVGGVVGSMGVETQFDLDGILSSTVTDTVSISTDTYYSRCILRQSVNTGEVNAKKDYAGGVCGLSELGVISSSENYGNVIAGGECVGGIAGQSKSLVTGSYAMCKLEGSEYIGGVTGQGRKILNCATMVEADPTAACCGGISGWIDTAQSDIRISGNLFVSDMLGGIDGINYVGVAEMCSYTELIERNNELPNNFKYLKASFRADGVIVKEISFAYNGSIQEEDIPEVPQKAGLNGFWPVTALENLTSSVVIDAIYMDRMTGLAAPYSREGSPLSVLILEGMFEPEACVEVSDWSYAIADSDEYLLVDAWTLDIRDRTVAEESYAVHYLMPDGVAEKNLSVFQLQEGTLVPVDFHRDGSYLIFDTQGDHVSFCVLESTTSTAQVILAVGAAAAAFVTVVALIVVFKKKQTKKRRAGAEAAAEA